jgi:2-methylisocitrate lyase-like PEP mutase family enzyme
MATATAQQAKAEAFLALHQRQDLFILPNAWDAASARVFEKAGFAAIGTTSAGIAASLGYRDGQQIPVREMMDAIKHIVSAVNLPVTADIEAGYSREVEKVLEVVREVMAMGVVGINIEDSTGITESPMLDIPSQVAKIRAIRNMVISAEKTLVINARIDLFYLGLYDTERATQETIERAHAYLLAGADCIFIFGVTDKAILSQLVEAIPGPINLLAGPGMPSAPELKLMGVRRLSLGSAAMRATLGTLEQISTELLRDGTYDKLTEKAVPYGELQKFFT